MRVAWVAAAVALSVLVLFDGPPRLAASLLLLWVLPGFAMGAAIMPPGLVMLGIAERTVVAVALSLTALAITGVVLDLAGVALRWPMLLAATWILVLTVCIVRVVVRVRTPHGGGPRPHPGERRRWLLSALAPALALVAALGIMALKPAAGSSFTELAVLTEDRTMSVVPLAAVAGEPSTLMIAIVNHEGRDVAYELTISGPDVMEPADAYRINLVDGDRQFVPVRVGWRSAGSDALVVRLYASDEGHPYRSVRVPVHVGPP